MITFVYDARGIGKAVNISKARISGVEATLRLDFLQFFRLTGNYTRQDPENRSEIRAFNGKRLPGRYETAYTANLEAGYGGIKVYGEYVVETGMYYDTANLLEAEDKKEFNAGISYWYDPFLFRLEGKNLSDDRYEAFNGYPVPGRAVYFTVTFRYS
jgi:iron complex outermembrane receptor protein